MPSGPTEKPSRGLLSRLFSVIDSIPNIFNPFMLNKAVKTITGLDYDDQAKIFFTYGAASKSKKALEWARSSGILDAATNSQHFERFTNLFTSRSSPLTTFVRQPARTSRITSIVELAPALTR